MNSREVEAQLLALADREWIRDLAIRYAQCVWIKDVASLVELLTEDGEMDTGGGQSLRGREAIRDTYQRVFADDDYYPFVHNHVIELGATEARGTCYLDLRAVTGGKRMAGFGSYADRYERTAGGWKFRSRVLAMHELRASSE